ALLETMREKEHGRHYDRELFDEQVRTAVRDVVHRQAEVGLDVVADGEMGKVNFITYVAERLSGFETEPGRSSRAPPGPRELEMFPEYYREYFKKYAATAGPLHVMVCRGPIEYVGQDAVKQDIANLKAALADVEVVEAFMPATSPRGFGGNVYYATDDEYA